MGNRIEEARLLKIMPPTFKEKCPCCGEPWTYDVINFHGRRTSIACKNGCFVFCRTQHFSEKDIQIAWGQLWRSFVSAFGASEAVRMSK